MNKTKDLLNIATEYNISSSENICKYIEDPNEKKELLNELQRVNLELEKLANEFDLQEKAINHVTNQLKYIKDLEIEKQYEKVLKSYREEKENSENQL